MLLFQAGNYLAWPDTASGSGCATVLIAAAKLRVPDYASVITFGNLGPGLHHGLRHRRDLQLTSRFARVLKIEALRHLSELSMNAIESTRLEGKWFGEGETANQRGSEGCVRRPFSGNAVHRSARRAAGRPPSSVSSRESSAPNQGTVKIKDQDIWSLSADKLADMRLNTVGFVFQDFHLFPRLTDGRERRRYL